MFTLWPDTRLGPAIITDFNADEDQLSELMILGTDLPGGDGLMGSIWPDGTDGGTGDGTGTNIFVGDVLVAQVVGAQLTRSYPL